MKFTTACVILCLVNCCLFLAPGISGHKIVCSQYVKDKKGQYACPDIYDPVCGTDGKTYANKCELCSKILRGSKLDIAYEGKCVDCSKYPQPQKGTAADCPKDYRPGLPGGVIVEPRSSPKGLVLMVETDPVPSPAKISMKA
ncbi:ovomucoid-like [Thamnophis elegans]|uniref:ovomucoid-like n=1 Tax=Thamnophis elegans TaxID=35005 RepID=UPI0013771D38|nr:ovomucoid-like [Thamnophis elegans]